MEICICLYFCECFYSVNHAGSKFVFPSLFLVSFSRKKNKKLANHFSPFKNFYKFISMSEQQNQQEATEQQPATEQVTQLPIKIEFPQQELVDHNIRNLFPFAFPGGVEEKEQLEPPPLHEDLEGFSFFELYQHIFDQMLPGEKILNYLKRLQAAGDNLDDAAKYISELYTRGEADIFDRDWVLMGISAGRIGQILDMKWDVLVEGQITGPFPSIELGPKARVLAAQDATVRPTGTEEWIPIDKINFGILTI